MTQSRKIGPPARIVAAAVIGGLLAVPMLAAAGSLFAHATSGDGFASVVSGLLSLAALVIAGVNLAGAVQLTQRGTAWLAQLGAYLTIGVTAVILTGVLMGRSPGVAVAMGLLFLAPAIAMLTLLGTARARRWLTARGRERISYGTEEAWSRNEP
ncbi:MAG: hypothetical protein ACRDTM_03165 [Micromonosporaceae bacterium]